MAHFSIPRFIVLVGVFVAGSLTSRAHDGSFKAFRHLTAAYKMKAGTDTIPATKKPEETAPPTSKQEETLPKPVEKIKEVPRSRRQVKPIAVPAVPVKPIKIIKPKIIRRTIGSVLP